LISDAFTQSDYAIDITDPDGVLLQVNKAYLRLYKIPEESRILGRTQRLIRSPETPESVYQDMWAALKAGRAWRGELTNRAFDGTPVFIHLTITPIRRQGRIVGYMGFSLDRGPQMMLEQELFHANKLAILGTWGAGLAHELNNPLASILLDAECMRELAERIPEASARQAALDASQSVIRGAERMRRVLEHLLLYAKKDTATARSTIDLSNLLQDSLLFLERQLRGRGIEIRVACEAGVYITGNRTQLESILHNLLGNSRDAFASHPRSDKWIVLTAEFLEDEAIAMIRYRDNAGGIDPAILDRIFEPFFTTKGGEGTGLGLAISRQVVERHGGAIECASAGEETEFRIRLPAQRGDASGEVTAVRADGGWTAR
jgi:PAS domain S-box-containing protein